MDIIRDADFDEALGPYLNKDFHKDFQYLDAAKRKKANIHLSAEPSQRERERQLREALKSRHGPTAEIHDQVYFKFLYIFMNFTIFLVNSSTEIINCSLFCSELLL